jgi:hypothetical protein
MKKAWSPFQMTGFRRVARTSQFDVYADRAFACLAHHDSESGYQALPADVRQMAGTLFPLVH